ncbi:mechanosensitive ion channel protein MscS [Nonomuraea sp. WAC 01424]|uniref:mechanosensitive ion channel family protein n=1 Tax=Nonomuraea sp. WAC 01424 TaxID=2203200 RepID=UPI000F7A9D9F|nr:mechanosensitive ion channel domain-containing protein [Nonomuraea sp. WAC 01424]RSN10487.1 mechanosensitive ion channel protein MscS [Nonomuraea sp. WAC 01424]
MQSPEAWPILVISVVGAVLLVEVVRRVLSRVGRKWALARHLVEHCTWPAFFVAVTVACNLAFAPGFFGESAGERGLAQTVDRVIALLTIGTVTWLIIQATYAMTDVVLDRLVLVEGERNRRARRIRTQIALVRRIAAAVIIVIALGAMLFSFPQVRALGAGLLASAGIAGAVLGVAAQPTIGNMLAGLQLAFSDALRLDDVVVVEKEWGRIEELTLTYVVLRLWDERRLVLPVSYFTTNPFENWTRHGSRVLAVVFLRVDWAVPVPKLRDALYEFLQGNPLWDQKDWTLQVTDVLPNGLVELRALMSAADSPSSWDLKCDVREFLVNFVRDNYPDALPRFRVETPETRVGVSWTGDHDRDGR